MHVNGLKNKDPRPASVAALSNTFNLLFLPCGSVGGATVIKIRSVGSNPTLVIYFLCPRVGPFLFLGQALRWVKLGNYLALL